MKTARKTQYATSYEFVAKINGHVTYLNTPFYELPDDTDVAAVRVIKNQGIETSRDQFIKATAWTTAKEGEEKAIELRNLHA